jgi:phosphoglycerate kinase
VSAVPQYRTLADVDLAGKRVLLRAGFDVPIENGKVHDHTRIEAILPTMKHILDAGASLILLSHQGRPKGTVDLAFTQRPLVPVLSELLGRPVAFADSCTGEETLAATKQLKPGDVLLLENLRFDPREEKNDPAFAAELASLGDLYVNDAFTNSHRDHASMTTLATLLPSCMGLQLEEEVSHLSKALVDPKRPLTLIVSGVKMETKIPVIKRFLEGGDDVLLGGAIANTFLAARGVDVSKSKYETEWIETAREILALSGKDGHATIHLPTDAVTAPEPSAEAATVESSIEALPDAAIFDVGPKTASAYATIIEGSGTVVWNGPLGFMEIEHFAGSSKVVAEAISRATQKGTISIVGGGDTIDFHERYGLSLSAYTFVSTGGGAMLEFIGGGGLPALAVLEK